MKSQNPISNTGHDKIVEELIRAGSEINGLNKGGLTALHYAAYYGTQHLASILPLSC